jgi:hypothetical protein
MTRLLRSAAIVAALLGLGGCVVAPAPYSYAPAAYAPGYAVYPAPVGVGVGFGDCFNCGWHRHYWR